MARFRDTLPDAPQKSESGSVVSTPISLVPATPVAEERHVLDAPVETGQDVSPSRKGRLRDTLPDAPPMSRAGGRRFEPRGREPDRRPCRQDSPRRTSSDNAKAVPASPTGLERFHARYPNAAAAKAGKIAEAEAEYLAFLRERSEAEGAAGEAFYRRAMETRAVRVGSKTETRVLPPESRGRPYEGLSVSFYVPEAGPPKGHGALVRNHGWRHGPGMVVTGVPGRDPVSKQPIMRRTVALCSADGVTDVDVQETVAAVWFQSPERQDWQSRAVPVDSGGVAVVSYDDGSEAACLVRRGRILSALLGKFLSLNDEDALILFLGVLFESNAKSAWDNTERPRLEYERQLAEWRAANDVDEDDVGPAPDPLPETAPQA